ncbi:hypothetical protein Tco_0250921 [Tanacetum coccineum]
MAPPLNERLWWFRCGGDGGKWLLCVCYDGDEWWVVVTAQLMVEMMSGVRRLKKGKEMPFKLDLFEELQRMEWLDQLAKVGRLDSLDELQRLKIHCKVGIL